MESWHPSCCHCCYSLKVNDFIEIAESYFFCIEHTIAHPLGSLRLWSPSLCYDALCWIWELFLDKLDCDSLQSTNIYQNRLTLRWLTRGERFHLHFKPTLVIIQLLLACLLVCFKSWYLISFATSVALSGGTLVNWTNKSNLLRLLRPSWVRWLSWSDWRRKLEPNRAARAELILEVPQSELSQNPETSWWWWRSSSKFRLIKCDLYHGAYFGSVMM